MCGLGFGGARRRPQRSLASRRRPFLLPRPFADVLVAIREDPEHMSGSCGPGRPSDMTGLRTLTMLKALIAEAESRFGARAHPAWVCVGLIDEGPPRATMSTTGSTSSSSGRISSTTVRPWPTSSRTRSCTASAVAAPAPSKRGSPRCSAWTTTSFRESGRWSNEAGSILPRRRHLQDIETLLRMDPDIVKRLREPPIAFEAIEPGDFVGRGVPTSLTTKPCRPADRD